MNNWNHEELLLALEPLDCVDEQVEDRVGENLQTTRYILTTQKYHKNKIWGNTIGHERF